MLTRGKSLVLTTWALFAISPAHTLLGQPSPIENIPFQPGSWTMVVVSDTQKYVDFNRPQQFPEVFNDTMQWIVDKRSDRNIQLVLQDGDIVDNNWHAEWQLSKNAISRLGGNVPYVLAPGNHDYGSGGSANNRNTLMNNYFSAADNPLNDPAQGGIIQGFFEPGKLDNTFSTFSAPDGRNLLILALEFAPRQRVVNWANEIAGRPEYQDHTAILVTHAYMEEGPPGIDGEPTPLRSNWAVYGTSRRYNPHAYGLANVSDPLDVVHDGEELWNELVSQHDSFQIVLNGHFLDDGDSNIPENGKAATAFQVDLGDNDVPVYQILANYQQQPNGGNGYVRLLEFLPAGRTVQVKTYSPTLDLWLTDPRNQFSFELIVVPEPSGLAHACAAMAFCGLGLVIRRRRK